MTKVINLIDQRFDRLLVLRKLPKHATRHETMWECVCNCGNITQASTRDLKSGRKRSCNCLKKDTSSSLCKSRNRTGYESAFNDLYGMYKRDAKTRNHIFELTMEIFRELTKLNCHYCGSKPSNIFYKWQDGKHISEYIYNGIDRKDNNIGYVYENCLPCCKICNRAKNNMSYEDFMDWVKKMANFINNK